MKNWFVTTMVISALVCPLAQAANKTETSMTTDRVSTSSTGTEAHQNSDRSVRHHRHGHHHMQRGYHQRHHHHRRHQAHHHANYGERSCCENSCGYSSNSCCVSNYCQECHRHHHMRGHHHHGKSAHHRHHGHDRKANRSGQAGYGYGYATDHNPQNEIDNPEKTNR